MQIFDMEFIIPNDEVRSRFLMLCLLIFGAVEINFKHLTLI